MKNTKIKQILNNWASKGFFAAWCDGCRCYTLYCPECGSNACGGGTRDCGACEVTFRHTQKLWDETTPILEEEEE
jgi:hypothetical protein